MIRRRGALLVRPWSRTLSSTDKLYSEEKAVVEDCESLVPAYRIRKPLKVPSHVRGVEILNEPLYNKGTGYDMSERDRLGLRGLVPPAFLSMEEQLQKIMGTLRAMPNDVAKHVYLLDLLDRNSTLFYRAVVRHIEELAPLIYTPTVGKACQLFGTVFRRTRGMYFSKNDVGHMSSMVANWPAKTVSVIVVTDGSRILGLGDLGVHGMGIPIGKLSLYCAAGGIAPHRVLPVVIDVGTDNDDLLKDPYYLGVRSKRLEGEEYFEVVDEFLRAVGRRWPGVLVQFEDFSSKNAQPLLDRYRHTYLSFNDDIQGTGATVVSGVVSALRLRGENEDALSRQKVVICGAGSAGIGCAKALCEASARDSGKSLEEAARNFYVLDARGLISSFGDDSTPDDFTEEQKFFSRRDDLARGTSLVDVIKAVKPSVLLGLTTVPGLFTKEIVQTLASACGDRAPVIMPLSNPTSNAECTAAQAYEWTNGNVVFASGSPFEPVEFDGKTMVPSQANNMFIFPGVGLGATLAKAKCVTDGMLHAAALACARSVTDEEMARGQVFPSVARIRDVSRAVAVAVIEAAIDENKNREPTELLKSMDGDLDAFVASKMYYPYYVPLYQSPYD